MVVDISKITLENINSYLYDVKKCNRKTKKEYQHNYYLRITKPKRKLKREVGNA